MCLFFLFFFFSAMASRQLVDDPNESGPFSHFLNQLLPRRSCKRMRSVRLGLVPQPPTTAVG